MIETPAFQCVDHGDKLAEGGLFVDTEHDGLLFVELVQPRIERIKCCGLIIDEDRASRIQCDDNGRFSIGRCGGSSFGKADLDLALRDKRGGGEHNREQHQHDVDKRDDIDLIEPSQGHD